MGVNKKVPLNSKQRGKVFENFIQQILLNSGFRKVDPDDEIIYEGPSGLMLHGLAQPHNTDVLVNPPFQIPFFFPSRLIVECKCYDRKAVDLQIIRGALGLREDVNGFDIITKKILKERRNYRRHGMAVSNRDRYFYQVAVASLSGFTKPAQEFALVHRIPLIDIKRMPFSNQVRKVLFSGGAEEKGVQANQSPNNENGLVDEQWQLLQKSLGDILQKFCIAILSSGDILFLYTESGRRWFFEKYVEEIELYYWTGNNNEGLWRIEPTNQNPEVGSWFELPDILFEQWAQKELDNKEALNIKEEYFRNIYVMGKDAYGAVRLKVLRLSKAFIDRARDILMREQERGSR